MTHHVDFYKNTCYITFAWHVNEQTFKPGAGGDKTRWFWCDVDTCPHGSVADRAGGFWWDVRTSPSASVAKEQMLGMRHQDICRPICGDRTGCFWEDVRTFLRMYLCRQKHDTSEHLQTCSRWQNQVFVMTRKNHSRCIWCRQNRMLFTRHLDNSRPVCCWQNLVLFCGDTTRNVLLVPKPNQSSVVKT